MSSNSSTSSIRQFGLYRTIDARTEEFLRLSRKRQLRQGCICAAISTAITVIVVIIVLLIYEYLIVVETNLVQNINSKYKFKHDQPIADKLDRSYFGFDQDYFERMPLLVNALQETSYIDPTSEHVSTTTLRKKKQHSQENNIRPETSHTIYKSIRRTTPRPFIFEYRSPNPTPFSRSFNSRSWVESYRNAQRLKNLNQVIKYLEKTLHAKFGDIYEPSTAQIAFSGVYVAPIKKKIKPVEDCHESQTSQRIEHKSNHLSDPLFVYKPENPGDINLLADGYRFSPTLQSHIRHLNNNIPMFRPVNKRKCVGSFCDYSSVAQNSYSVDAREPHSTKENKPRAFGVMLDLYPIQSSNFDESIEVKRTSPIDKIYFTTVRPSYQFKKKPNHSNMHVIRTSFRPKISKTRDEKRNSDVTTTQTSSHIETTTVPQLVVRFNVYSVRKNSSILKEPNSHHSATTTTTTTESIKHDIQLPVIASSNVEDYHAGSSGIIPVQDRTPAPSTYPIITPTITQYDQQYLSTESITTNPPDIIKFSPEDAKVPDEYINFNMRKSDISLINEFDLEQKYSEYIEPKLEADHSSAALKGQEKEEKTLVIKLKNIVGTTTEIPTTETIEYTEEYIEENTTTNEPGDTYVPTINGHYRSSKRKTLSTLFYENSEKYRKKKIETSITLQKSTYVPMYVEIKRNRTLSTENY
ncbi:uncharacterized protein LOC125056790 isoform X2 [Pieris napi]|uniref:uncharacterized protein LOC125056790 isoform X2 n=1 Tax=Pieris napi TaxID=78633 RepID=UPI001FBBA73C|nr:uncharacterized protein LOC125056790 isoform X2 [Pieris napi]